MSFTLLDWRRRVAAMYAAARSGSGPEGGAPATATRFRATKDQLFAAHPDTPIPPAERDAFDGLAYWPYDPKMRFIAAVEPMEPAETSASSSSGDIWALRRIGRVQLPLGQLDVDWVDVYGGGIFLPFRDGTSGEQSYGAGRYLLDTIKGADLGGDARGLVLDFNYAYHPSCAYDPIWSCPLAPRSNWLSGPIRAGERLR